MKVYKYADSISETPYLDNCYIGLVPRNENDIDVTNPFNLYEFFRVGQIDYIQYRKYLKQDVLPNWDSLSSIQKIEMVKHNVAPSQLEKDSFFSQAEQIDHYIKIVGLEVEARQARWNEAMSRAAFYLLGNDLARLMMYNDSKIFRNDYIEADLPHLILWISDGSYPQLGIDFTSNGFGSKPYYNQSIKNAVLEVLLK